MKNDEEGKELHGVDGRKNKRTGGAAVARKNEQNTQHSDQLVAPHDNPHELNICATGLFLVGTVVAPDMAPEQPGHPHHDHSGNRNQRQQQNRLCAQSPGFKPGKRL